MKDENEAIVLLDRYQKLVEDLDHKNKVAASYIEKLEDVIKIQDECHMLAKQTIDVLKARLKLYEE